MNLPDLPEESRVWVFAADRAIDETQSKELLAALQPFLGGWSSHGSVVNGTAHVLHGRFLLLAASMPDGDLSGCGIDKSVHAIDAAGERAGVRWHPAIDVAWRDPAGAIRVDTRSAFRQAVAQGEINDRTSVFDLTIETGVDWRSGRFERPASDSWHSGVFRIPAPAL